jgi:hypothetical protein
MTLAAAMCQLTTASAGIAPGVGIGHVRLGMTLKQVEHLLGRPQTIDARRTIPIHRTYIEYGWNYGATSVGFVRQGAATHAALIATGLASDRTPEGVGVGTHIQRFRRQLPNAACFLGYAWVNHPYCVVNATGTRRTIFVLKCVVHEFACSDYLVKRVIVRSAL